MPRGRHASAATKSLRETPRTTTCTGQKIAPVPRSPAGDVRSRCSRPSGSGAHRANASVVGRVSPWPDAEILPTAEAQSLARNMLQNLRNEQRLLGFDSSISRNRSITLLRCCYEPASVWVVLGASNNPSSRGSALNHRGWAHMVSGYGTGVDGRNRRRRYGHLWGLRLREDQDNIRFHGHYRLKSMPNCFARSMMRNKISSRVCSSIA